MKSITKAVRLSAEEAAEAETAAKTCGLSISDLLRIGLRRVIAEIRETGGVRV